MFNTLSLKFYVTKQFDFPFYFLVVEKNLCFFGLVHYYAFDMVIEYSVYVSYVSSSNLWPIIIDKW